MVEPSLVVKGGCWFRDCTIMACIIDAGTWSFTLFRDRGARNRAGGGRVFELREAGKRVVSRA